MEVVASYIQTSTNRRRMSRDDDGVMRMFNEQRLFVFEMLPPRVRAVLIL